MRKHLSPHAAFSRPAARAAPARAQTPRPAAASSEVERRVEYKEGVLVG